MKVRIYILTTIFTICTSVSHSQNKQAMNEQQNPLLCNPANGICEIPTSNNTTAVNEYKIASTKPIKVIYFTDPICSSCWGIEPQLKKLKLAYANTIEVEYRMGGLLPDWNYNSGGISKPTDVAHHWDEVSIYYDMPIDGDIWLEDPLASSYPPSIAFKAAQLQNEQKAFLFLREIREMVFLQKKNITKWQHLETAAQKVGLNIQQFKTDYEGKATILFNEDVKLAKEYGVRGFPTLFFMDTTGKREIISGSKPYSSFETAIIKLAPNALKINYDTSWKMIFTTYHSLTAKEFSVLTSMPRNETEPFLNQLTLEGKLEKFTTKNGSIWLLKTISY